MSGDFNIQQNSKTMKKLSLEMLRLSSDEVLDRSQMKKITGGMGVESLSAPVPAAGETEMDTPCVISQVVQQRC
jgi:hypothetical protein